MKTSIKVDSPEEGEAGTVADGDEVQQYCAAS